MQQKYRTYLKKLGFRLLASICFTIAVGVYTSSVHAALITTTLTFDDLPTGVFSGTLTDTQGFTYAYIGFGDAPEIREDIDSGNKVYADSALNSSGARILIHAPNNVFFDVLTMDIGDFNEIAYSDGINFAIVIQDSFDYYPTSLQTVTPANDLVNVTGIDVLDINVVSNISDYWIDNIVVRYDNSLSVPEPDTYALLAVGVIVAALRKRRKTQ